MEIRGIAHPDRRMLGCLGRSLSQSWIVSPTAARKETLGKLRGVGKLPVGQSFQQPVRLLVRIKLIGEATRHPEISLHGSDGGTPTPNAWNG